MISASFRLTTPTPQPASRQRIPSFSPELRRNLSVLSAIAAPRIRRRSAPARPRRRVYGSLVIKSWFVVRVTEPAAASVLMQKTNLCEAAGTNQCFLGEGE